MHRADFEWAMGGHGHGQFFSYGQRAGTGKPGFFVQGNGQGRVLVFGQRAGKQAFLKLQFFPKSFFQPLKNFFAKGHGLKKNVYSKKCCETF